MDDGSLPVLWRRALLYREVMLAPRTSASHVAAVERLMKATVEALVADLAEGMDAGLQALLDGAYE